MLSPCKDCTKRYVGCHNVEKCKEWAVFVEDQKKKREWKLEQYMLDRDVEYRYKRMGVKDKQR